MNSRSVWWATTIGIMGLFLGYGSVVLTDAQVMANTNRCPAHRLSSCLPGDCGRTQCVGNCLHHAA